MAPSILQLSTQLRQIIYYHLDNDLLDNALFLAERLHGLDPRSSDALHLLALCHHRLGEHKIAYDYLRVVALRGGNLPCVYVFAQVCLQLKKNAEGISVLERVRPLWDGRNTLYKHSDTVRRHMPDAAAVQCLLGKLFQADRDIKRSVECYVESLKLNPFMWDAFERLCDTGANIRTSNIFKLSYELLSLLASSSKHLNSQALIIDQENTNATLKTLPGDTDFHDHLSAHDPFISSLSNADQTVRKHLGTEALSMEASQAQPIVQREAMRTALEVEPPNAPSRKPRNTQLVPGDTNSEMRKSYTSSSRDFAGQTSEDAGTVQVTSATLLNQHKRTISGSVSHGNNTVNNPPVISIPQRRSRRLFGKPPSISSVTSSRDVSEFRKAKATGTKGRAAATSTVGRVVSGNRKPIESSDLLYKESRPQLSIVEPTQSISKNPTPNHLVDTEALRWFLDLLERLGNGYCASSRFQCQAALQHYNSVPQLQRETAWVLAQIGKTLHQQGKYIEAECAFSRMRKKFPSRIRDMEVYSTVLWHLKSDTELAFLAHELVDVERSAPQSWCTVGNSFSLQRDHDQALKCFRRATQLDPGFAYGFTLQGHEYCANEEYEKALQAYRRAVSADHRHHNGWYGLAKVYEKLGKYDMAVEHYKAAATINSTNALLVWSIGMVLEKQKKPQAALAHYKRACELAPSSTMPRFKKARVLLNLHRYQEALDEFNILKDMVPDEPNVHFMLGRVHKQLRNKSEAVKHFTIALNLDPKAAPHIKETMESIDQEDDDMSEDDDGDDEMP